MIGLAVLAATPAMAASPYAPVPSYGLSPLKVSANGHYLTDANGKPFFWLGDTAWELPRAVSDAEQDYYLTTRARQGYTVIQTVVTCVMDVPHRPGQDGYPFLHDDANSPNPVFFDRIARLVERANRLGLYVALLPAWGDRLTAPWGEGPLLFRLDDLKTARAYGRFLGARLRQYPNIIWVLGGDRPTKAAANDYSAGESAKAGFAKDTDWAPIWAAMAQGLDEGTGMHRLTTFHPMGDDTSDTSRDIGPVAWLDVNGIQSGHAHGQDKPVWQEVAHDWAVRPAKPTIDLEPNYEDHPINPWPEWNAADGFFTDYDVRKQNYRSVFAGAAGVTYGHQSIWPFVGGAIPAHNHGFLDWQTAMVRPGGAEMPYLRALIESRPMLDRIPADDMVVHGQGDAGLHVVATREAAGRYAFVYIPLNNYAVTLDLSALKAKTLNAWWYNPRTGMGRLFQTFAPSGAWTVTTPFQGPDWVLVLDDATQRFAPPGLKE